MADWTRTAHALMPGNRWQSKQQNGVCFRSDKVTCILCDISQFTRRWMHFRDAARSCACSGATRKMHANILQLLFGVLNFVPFCELNSTDIAPTQHLCATLAPASCSGTCNLHPSTVLKWKVVKWVFSFSFVGNIWIIHWCHWHMNIYIIWNIHGEGAPSHCKI